MPYKYKSKCNHIVALTSISFALYNSLTFTCTKCAKIFTINVSKCDLPTFWNQVSYKQYELDN